MPQTVEKLLTAEEYAALPDGRRTELVKGRIVDVPPPGLLHGFVQVEIASLLREYARSRRVGREMTESGAVTERGPDTVRGPDVSFYSHDRIPEGPLPQGYSTSPPNFVFEVLSPKQGLRTVLPKVSEYLAAGASSVCVVDPVRRTAVLYNADDTVSFLNADDTLHLPAPLEGWTPRIRDFFPE